jgi:hypothetical protein
MNKCNGQEKSRGVLAFAKNTDAVNYEKIAELSLRLAKHNLKLPVKVINTLPDQPWHNTRHDPETKQTVKWNNYGRYMAYEMSPWDETIVIDADYLVLTDNLNKLFETKHDYILADNMTLVGDNVHYNIRQLAPVWATVFFFRKTPHAQAFFEMVGKIQRNWDYYRLLFNHTELQYRNDFAFAMARVVLDGYTKSVNTSMPLNLITLTEKLNSLEFKDELLLARYDTHADLLPRRDLHIFSKSWLQSPALEKFVNEATS